MSSLEHGSDHEVLALAGKVAHQLGQALMEATAVLVLSYLLFLVGALALASIRSRLQDRTDAKGAISAGGGQRSTQLARFGRPVS